jgi:DNA modification methylase
VKPYYKDKFATVYHGHTEEILPQLSPVAAIVTDPPYGINENSKKAKTRGNLAPAGVRYGDFSWDQKPPADWLFGLMREKSAYQVIFGGNYFPLPPSSCWLVWDKENGANDFADCELAWTNLPKAVRRIKWRWNGMLQEDMANKEPRFHPTQKPLPVMVWAIGQLPNTIACVLDPYAGSGTTLVAAKQLGKLAIGIEREERYCEDIAMRLQQEYLPLSSPTQPVSLQEEML